MAIRAALTSTPLTSGLENATAVSAGSSHDLNSIFWSQTEEEEWGILVIGLNL